MFFGFGLWKYLGSDKRRDFFFFPGNLFKKHKKTPKQNRMISRENLFGKFVEKSYTDGKTWKYKASEVKPHNVWETLSNSSLPDQTSF